MQNYTPKTPAERYLTNPLLLVIDMQNIYSAGQEWECPHFARALENITRLLAQVPYGSCLLTRYIAPKEPQGVWADYNREYEAINRNDWGNQLADALLPFGEQYPVIDKSVYSSLGAPEVREAVNKASCVAVTGVVAECCVLSTVLSLIDEGIYVIYLRDAVAGITEEAEQAVITVLEGMAPLHLTILTTEKYQNLTAEP